LATPQALYGLGGEDEAGQLDQAPVAVPLQVSTTSATFVDVDIAAAAYDPDGPGLPEIAAVGAPAHGLGTATQGKIRYTPVAGYVGPDSFAYTLDNAGKRSQSVVRVQVVAGSQVPTAYQWF
jgi:large repetitive protein